MNAYFRFLKKHRRINKIRTKLLSNMVIVRIHWYLVTFPKLIIGYIRFHNVNLDQNAKYEVIKTIKASGLIHFKAPFTDGFDCDIQPSTILVQCTHYPTAPAFTCLPENKEDFEKKYISSDVLNDSKFNGFSLVILCKYIKKHLKQL
jgi:hypothetical protein